MSSSGGGGERRMVELRRGGAGPGSAVIEVEVGCGVNLGLVGRVVGVEPSTVRLNGHYLSRGPNLVSCVTWASLLSFFTARGLPTGDHGAGGPIIVQGNPVACKRKATMEENESPLKKLKVTEHNAGALVAGNGQVRHGCNFGTKKRKVAECSSDLADEACKLAAMVAKTGVGGYSCIDGHGKRMREDDIAAAFTCKRIR